MSKSTRLVSQEQPLQSAPAVTSNRFIARQGPTSDQIARRAYEIYLARGGEHGRDQDDWFQAERELRLGAN